MATERQVPNFRSIVTNADGTHSKSTREYDSAKKTFIDLVGESLDDSVDNAAADLETAMKELDATEPTSLAKYQRCMAAWTAAVQMQANSTKAVKDANETIMRAVS
jgi:type III secretion apparatus needle protein